MFPCGVIGGAAKRRWACNRSGWEQFDNKSDSTRYPPIVRSSTCRKTLSEVSRAGKPRPYLNRFVGSHLMVSFARGQPSTTSTSAATLRNVLSNAQIKA